MRIHAGTSGTLPREVGRSLSGHDQVFLAGKKRLKEKQLYNIIMYTIIMYTLE